MSKCGSCSKRISRFDDYITCTGQCATSYHVSCAGLSVELLEGLKFSGDIKSWVCRVCTGVPNLQPVVDMPTEPVLSEQSLECLNGPANRSVEDVITMKVKYAINAISDEVISLLKKEINNLRRHNCSLEDTIGTLKTEMFSLNTEICSLKEETVRLRGCVIPSTDGPVVSQILSKVNTMKTSNNKKALSENIHNKKDTHECIATSEKKRNARKPTDSVLTSSAKKTYASVSSYSSDNVVVVMDTSIAPASSSATKDTKYAESASGVAVEDGFQLVTNKNKNKNKKSLNKGKVTVGAALNTNIKAIVNYSYLHISKLDKNTTIEDIEEYLKSLKFSDFKCDKLVSKRPDIYSSFRVGVPPHLLDRLKNPETWPLGTFINRFFWRPTPTQPPS